ncbi:MAG: PilN domain-containing protein [Candidatus Binatia bacterium]
MIRINLLPVKELKQEIVRRRELMIGVLSLALTGALVLGVYGYQWRQVSGLETELDGLRKELQVLNVKAKNVVELQKKIKEFSSKSKVIEDINKKKSGPVRVMESLSAATPNALWLTEFKETGGNLAITGVAADNQTIAEFLKALSSHAYFNNTELVETTQNQQAGMPPRKFLIRSRLTYQPNSSMPTGDKSVANPARKDNAR